MTGLGRTGRCGGKKARRVSAQPRPDSLKSLDQSDGMKGGDAILWGFRCRLSLSATKSQQSDLYRLRAPDAHRFPNKMDNLPSLMEDLSVTFHREFGGA